MATLSEAIHTIGQNGAESPHTSLSRDTPLHYRAFGLQVHSDLPLPEFEMVLAEAEADVTVRLAAFEPEELKRSQTTVVSRGESEFYFPGAGAFHVRDGKEIVIVPSLDAGPDLLRLYVEGMMMATVLYQRGFPVLHASVVALGSRAVAFVGHVGAGKSSMAAALHARGHAVLTDDNAVIELENGAPVVRPSFPFIKIFPAIAESLGSDGETLRPLHQAMIKQGQSVAAGFPRQPVTLDRVYVLCKDAQQPLARLHGPEALVELIRNSVPTRWAHRGDSLHFQQCARIAAQVPFFRVRTFDTLTELPLIAARLEQHCHAE